MTLISRTRLVFIVLALCAVLTVAPLASAQTEPLPMPGIGEPNGREDDLTPSINISPTILRFTVQQVDDPLTTEIMVYTGEDPVQVSIKLHERPPGVVTMHYDDTTELIMQPEELTFTQENWNMPQIVNVYAAPDHSQTSNRNTIEFMSGRYRQPYKADIVINGLRNHVNLVHTTQYLSITAKTRMWVPFPQDLVVTTLADSITEVIPGSLRQVMYAQGTNNPITFAPGLSGTIHLVADLPHLHIFNDNTYTRNFTVKGPGQDLITIDGGGLFNAFVGKSRGVHIQLEHLTITNTRSAVKTIGPLTLSDVTIHNSGHGSRLSEPLPPIEVWTGEDVVSNITRVTMYDNSGIYGGAMSLQGDAIITDSTFRNNVAQRVVTPYDTIAFGGGAIFFRSRQLLIQSSTFVENSGANAGVIASLEKWTDGFVVIINSTFSGNFSTRPKGAAVINAVNIRYTVIFSTFSGHHVGAGMGGVVRAVNSGFIIMEGNVIANNNAASPLECVGQAFGAVNFSADSACNVLYPKGRPTGVDPVLRDNGGLTMTHALMANSNVLNSDQPIEEEGGITLCENYAQIMVADQRAVARPQFEYCDLGAFESEIIPLPPANQASNGSFETAGIVQAQAEGWNGVNLNPKDIRRCDSPESPLNAPNGQCVFQFRGANSNTEPRLLTQTLNSTEWALAGNTLRLSAQVRTKNLGAGGRLLLDVVYEDGTTGTALVRIPAGTNPYQRVMVRLPLAKRADSVTITVRLKTGGNQNTRLWVDNVILVSQ